MANEKIKYETEDDNIPPEKRIAKFIHLMSEGINHHQVICNGVTITLEYSETESSEDMVNCIMYMTKEDLELKGYSFFKFFYRAVAPKHCYGI